MPMLQNGWSHQNLDLLSVQQVADCLAVSVRTVWRMLARGNLPQPIRYSRRLVRWRSSDLAAWLEQLSPGETNGTRPISAGNPLSPPCPAQTRPA